MRPKALRSTAEATRHLMEIVGRDRKLRVQEFDAGWVARAILTPEEQAAGAGLGLAASVVDRETGVVTVHPSLPMDLIAQRYSVERAAGQITGNQIWPWTAQHAAEMVRFARQEPIYRPVRTEETAEDVWVVTPLPTEEETTAGLAPTVTYVADGLTMTVWEYPATTPEPGSTYLAERGSEATTGRKVYPIPT